MAKKKGLIIVSVVAGLLVIGGIGNALGAGDKAPPVKEPSGETVTVPDVVGMKGDDARTALTELGLDVDWGDETVFMASNWTVDDQAPLGGSDATEGDTVTLTVSKPKPETPAAEADESRTPSGLGFGWATTGCDEALTAELSYGFNAKWLLDGIHRIEGDTMFLKAGGWAKNAFGTKQDLTFECTVSGTDEAPVVDSLIYY